MKKAFTLVEMLVVASVLALVVFVIFASSGSKLQPKPTPSLPKNFVILSSETLGDDFRSDPDILIVKDKETNVEYLVVHHNGISITPRLYPKKEE